MLAITVAPRAAKTSHSTGPMKASAWVMRTRLLASNRESVAETLRQQVKGRRRAASATGISAIGPSAAKQTWAGLYKLPARRHCCSQPTLRCPAFAALSLGAPMACSTCGSWWAIYL